MADEVRADPQAIVKLAKATLAAADAMTDSWSASQGAVAPVEAAYGNSTAGPALAAAIAGAEAAVDTIWRRVTGVYEGDVDRLYRVVFAYQQADSEAAERQRRAAGGKRPI